MTLIYRPLWHIVPSICVKAMWRMGACRLLCPNPYRQVSLPSDSKWLTSWFPRHSSWSDVANQQHKHDITMVINMAYEVSWEDAVPERAGDLESQRGDAERWLPSQVGLRANSLVKWLDHSPPQSAWGYLGSSTLSVGAGAGASVVLLGGFSPSGSCSCTYTYLPSITSEHIFSRSHSRNITLYEVLSHTSDPSSSSVLNCVLSNCVLSPIQGVQR